MTDHACAPEPGSGAMFDRIAERYDLLNRVISFGLDRGWRRRTAKALELGSESHVLDIATGTADLALEIARRYADARVVALDPAPRMLEIGARKVERCGLRGHIEFVEGHASRLPFPDESFDACAMAFGIRNMPDRSEVLREVRRVTRRGGKVGILELSEPGGGLLGLAARCHVHGVVPLVGALLSGAAEYRYLSRSIAAFPPPEQFLRMLARAGFERTRAEALGGGVAYLYVGHAGGVA
jgi:demethylmenaquinone methyltransferase / 2-methoxy-6-polyprenyl-1,4-benzoquinol methylase